MKSIFLFSLFLYTLNASAAVKTEILCFTTAGKKPTRFELRTYYDTKTKWEAGYINYAKSKKKIPVVLKESTSESVNKDSPDQSSASWLEVSGGNVSGLYEMEWQGTIVGSMIYTNFKSGKKFRFVQDPNTETSLDKGCEWEK